MREFNDNRDNRGNNYDDCLFCPYKKSWKQFSIRLVKASVRP